MYGVDILMEEHRRLLDFADMIKRLCCSMLEGKEADPQMLRECVEFGRNYADFYHHGKEEKILFRYMVEKLGSPAEKMVQDGMLTEHNLGRYHLGELEKAIDAYEKDKCTEHKLAVITTVTSYTDLLRRHIDKEDGVCYMFALRMLSDQDKEGVDRETEAFEEEEGKGIKEKYLSWLEAQIRQQM